MTLDAYDAAQPQMIPFTVKEYTRESIQLTEVLATLKSAGCELDGALIEASKDYDGDIELTLVGMRLETKQEVARRIQLNKEIQERRAALEAEQAAQEKLWIQTQEAHERAQLALLKAKYEGK